MIPVEIPAQLTKDERYRLISARLAALAAAAVFGVAAAESKKYDSRP